MIRHIPFIALLLVPCAIAEPASPDTSCGGFKSGGADCAGQLSAKAKGSAQKEMLATYKNVLKALPESNESPDLPGRETVVAFQKAWSRYYKEFCSLYGEFKGGAPSWKSSYSVECEEGAVIEQTRILNAILKCAKQGGGGGCVLPSPMYKEE
jgi:hypothetical protein